MSNRIEALQQQLAKRIMLLDGGMGTMIQSYKLDEADFRGQRFADWQSDLKGNNDLLVLTRPDIISEIHHAYLEAGADILETNTFNSTTIAMADYHMASLSAEINLPPPNWHAPPPMNGPRARRIARATWRACSARPTAPAQYRPTSSDPAFRNVTFNQLVDAYRESTRALVEGGCDIIMIETVFDTLNAKAAIFAVESEFEALGITLPLMISGTLPMRLVVRCLARRRKRSITHCAMPGRSPWPELRAGPGRAAPVRG